MDHTLYSNHIGKWIFLNFSGNIHENLFAQNSYVLFFLTNSELINLKNIYQPSKFFLNHIGGKTLKLSASQRLSRYTLTFSQLMHYPVREVILPYKEKLNFKLVKKPFDQYQLNKVLINKMKITSLPNFKINFDKGIISFNADQSFKKIFVTVPKIKKESIENKCSLRICVNKRRKVQKIHDYILDITISPIIMP